MPVIPQSAKLLQNFQYLYDFLAICQQASIANNHSQIASISLEIDPVDPLAVLQKIGTHQPHFFCEQRSSDRSIVMIGSAVSKEISGADRFSQTQEFIQLWSTRLIPFSPSHLPENNPYFFCNFTFGDRSSADQPTSPSARVYLPEWQIIRQSNRFSITTNVIVHSHSNLELAIDKIRQQLQTICSIPDRIPSLFTTIQLPFQHQTDQTETFTETVKTALDHIRAGILNKVVLAHAIDVVFPLPIQSVQALYRLRQTYPECYVFSISNGQEQTFIGASPERLLSVSDRLLTTDALAGSAPRGATPEADQALIDRLLNSPKEQHEHRVVVDFITQQLMQLGLTPQWASQPQLLQLSNIQHLHTPIQAVLPASLHPLTVLAQLHPTPAVAGMPRDVACEYIQCHEPFERSLYAAPLGWIDTQGNAEFIVGIRSALIVGQHARLYGGAGIVAGSNPERELAEVKLKLQALLQALQG